MLTVWKFQLEMTGRVQEVLMPDGAQVLSFQVQHNQPTIWAQVYTDAPLAERKFVIVGTGHELPSANVGFIGTVQVQGGAFVFHLFEVTI